MCGIVSITYRNENPDMGKEASALLRRLEYRGYDSTGASFIDEKRSISLMKKVGAPSKVCSALGMEACSGQRFIGQVRWATYGAVTDVNSQPHHVRCKAELVGAHNGNISNTDSLKSWLSSRGHAVVSDNDGEIIVHLIEEAYAANRDQPIEASAAMRRAFGASGLPSPPPDAVLLMVDAIRKAEALAQGSYAAAVADPALPGVFAVKSGSSLYAGLGVDARGEFIVISSDLTSVLSKTRALIPLAEGEGIWFTEKDYLVFSLKGETSFSRPRLKRSKLNVRDTALDPRFKHYMEQEILGGPENIERILRYYFKDLNEEDLATAFEEKRELCKEAADRCAELADRFGDEELRSGAAELLGGPVWAELSARANAARARRGNPTPSTTYISEERELLAELGRLLPERVADLALLDSVFVWRKRRAVTRYLGELNVAIRESQKSGGRVYVVASGTSYHAALTAAYFFDSLAGLPVYPCNPGMFRSMYFSSLTSRDLLLGISQSGETKDLVDIFQDLAERVPGLRRCCLVNNENSRIPQELCDFYLPILCGPEIAVAATKSFLNQLAILYVIAAAFSLPAGEIIRRLRSAQALIGEAIRSAGDSLETVAQRLFLRPSLHILGTGLIGLAREGALKIREVVLNHAEGYDTAEFKHGPNTILGKNTVFSADDIVRALSLYRDACRTDAGGPSPEPLELMKNHPEILEGLFRDYPLVFICPPDDRDTRITISQIHTHKIRGADIILIAEPNPELSLAVRGKPMGNESYWSHYVEVPFSGDPQLFVFAATVLLQLLAYRMSVKKKEWLDALHVADHGVHPDAPKNVSKSITVD
ncbi:MAG TPA: SIS domain-containing protein [Rectinemataceae bacterium]|nr:SIS domain-containing protein [Rectinemataceae bacterium]